jgi:hypothetical protein
MIPISLFLKAFGLEIAVMSFFVLCLYFSTRNYYDKFVFPPEEKKKEE